ncbi:transporter substrate-binding domain-containing protein [Desulfolutivibrio sulfoxidireducens]|uniref:transporter substrate-binding domain-containing protein n=1 Tax=Desulfolutivibrio sulfoxidireducens TaxID=2773299 RepID=UPI00159D8C20|nr:transporter substrate-binding domain-containing protein [Desulfolutivibrio sulfoxidireducens]
MRNVLVVMVFLWAVFSPGPPARAQAAGQPAAVPQKRVLTVGAMRAPPFSFQDAQGEWRGIGIDLWDNVAEEMGVEYVIKKYELKGLLDALERGEVDVAAAPLPITPENINHLDFSQAYYFSGLGIAVPRQPARNIFFHVVEELFSTQFLAYVALMGVLLVASGLVVWWIERRINPDQFGRGARGIVDGMWWSAVTMTTVGYGDAAPKSVFGRLLGMVWMFASVVLVSIFTASITTTLTVGRIGGKVAGPEDLSGAVVACVSQGSAEFFLRHTHIKPHTYPDLAAALTALANKEVDAVVDDRPLLLHTVRNAFGKKIEVLGASFDPTAYAFAFPLGGELRKPVNIALWRLRRDRDYWKGITGPYLGE